MKENLKKKKGKISNIWGNETPRRRRKTILFIDFCILSLVLVFLDSFKSKFY